MHPYPASNPNAQNQPYAPMQDSYQYEYQDHDEHPSQWLEKEQGSTKKSKWVLWTAVGVGALLIIGGIVAGIAISHSKKGSSNASTGSKNSTTSTSGDPSKFTKNPDLKQSFYGFGYTPVVSSKRCYLYLYTLRLTDNGFIY